MSTEYMPSKRIAFERIKHFSYGGVCATVEDGDMFLTDGTSYLWVYPACKGRRVTFIRQGDNDEDRIIEVLEAYFRVWLVSEYEDEFHEIIKTERMIARRLKAKRKAASTRGIAVMRKRAVIITEASLRVGEAALRQHLASVEFVDTRKNKTVTAKPTKKPCSASETCPDCLGCLADGKCPTCD